MTEREAWLKLAEAIEHCDNNGTYSLPQDFYYKTRRGISEGLTGWVVSGLIAMSLRDHMIGRLRTKRPKRFTGGVGFWWSLTRAGNRRRAEVCRELAEEATHPKKRKAVR